MSTLHILYKHKLITPHVDQKMLLLNTEPTLKESDWVSPNSINPYSKDLLLELDEDGSDLIVAHTL